MLWYGEFMRDVVLVSAHHVGRQCSLGSGTWQRHMAAAQLLCTAPLEDINLKAIYWALRPEFSSCLDLYQYLRWFHAYPTTVNVLWFETVKDSTLLNPCIILTATIKVRHCDVGRVMYSVQALIRYPYWSVSTRSVITSSSSLWTCDWPLTLKTVRFPVP